MRFTIDEYAKAYSISPEMVKSRLRRNRLNYIIEDETTYIVVPRHQVPHSKEENIETQPKEKKTTVATVISLYQKENHYLKLKIKELEEKVDRLVSEKEQLLKDERNRIEKIYTDKDQQLKTVLELLNTKLLHDAHTTVEAEVALESIEAKLEEVDDVIELKQYLKSKGLSSAERKVIKRRFAEAFGSDARITLHNGQFYLDFSKYDYTDLLG